jgi:hypothetical protein
MHGARATAWLIPSATSLLFSGRMAAPLIRADGFVSPCTPSLAHKPPSGPDWVHEIKHDGYRLDRSDVGQQPLLEGRRRLLASKRGRNVEAIVVIGLGRRPLASLVPNHAVLVVLLDLEFAVLQVGCGRSVCSLMTRGPLKLRGSTFPTALRSRP